MLDIIDAGDDMDFDDDVDDEVESNDDNDE